MKIFLLISSFVFAFSVEAVTIDNKLENHASPYLAMHGSDPVAWQEWNKDSVKRAKKEGKLLYVSSGYFSCHWCHVMQRESYKNKEVAKLLNTYFIPIKVDREINVALDTRLIDFVERTQGRAGWPLNVFITPDGNPLVGMTYVPTKNFISMLKIIKTRWSNERPKLENMAKKATSELSIVAAEGSSNLEKGLAQKYSKLFIYSANAMADTMTGGFGQQNKFPLFPQLKALLTLYENNHDENLKQFLLLTLDNMASQGLYDHLDGGFFRYAVDPGWQMPHFEKMLYDNALLASLYIDAARILKNKKFTQIAKQTLDFMLGVLRSDEGAYIASLSAVDGKGAEGGYYLWHKDELKKILTKEELNIAELIWKLNGTPELEAGHHLLELLNISEAAEVLKISPEKAVHHVESAKKKMLRLRNKRTIPRDDKLLAAWNGLALSAFAKAAKQYNSVRYAKAATDIKNYIYSFLWKNNKLSRAVKANKVLAEGSLEDYAYVAQALYDWSTYSDDKQDKIWLNALIEQAWKRFHTQKGWRLEENSLLKYGENEAIIPDGVLPSASAILIHISLMHAEKNNIRSLKIKALKALNVAQADIESQPFMYASHIMTLFEYEKGNKPK